MAKSFVCQASIVALLATSTFAQTFTTCDPTKKTCPADAGLSSSTYSVDFTKGADDKAWSAVSGNVSYTANGAEFTIHKQGDAPTIQTSWYFFFGRAEVHMKAAPGAGIVSSVVLESDDLDEVDWEWLGGQDGQVQTNYFGKGNTTTYDRGAFSNVADAQGVSHNYTIDWTKDQIVWYIDGAVTRTLNFADAVGGKNFPQTPMRLRLGIWAGGDPSNSPGTISWAGGPTDYSKVPFTMSVQSVSITNANPAKSYSFGDQTGSWQSIKIDTTSSPSTGNAAAGDGTKSGQNGEGNSVSPSASSMSAAMSATAPAGSMPSSPSGDNGTTMSTMASPTVTGASASASATTPATASGVSGKLSTTGFTIALGGVLVALAGLI